MGNLFEQLVNSWKMKNVQKSDIENTIRRIQEQTDKADPGSEQMTKLGVQMEQALKNKKLFKEAKRFGLDPNTVLMALLLFGISAFAFSLDLEIPMALKHAGYLTKLPIAKLHF